ncbi:MAG: hypothetical protein KDK48_01710 [Chlamydiia bacterium]|nr:hypothetical protein [Chlamydiia bacterium]
MQPVSPCPDFSYTETQVRNSLPAGPYNCYRIHMEMQSSSSGVEKVDLLLTVEIVEDVVRGALVKLSEATDLQEGMPHACTTSLFFEHPNRRMTWIKVRDDNLFGVMFGTEIKEFDSPEALKEYFHATEAITYRLFDENGWLTA